MVERYLSPLLIPLAVAVVIVAYVLDVTRVFLAANGTVAVVVGAILTLSILAGAATLAAGERLRSGSIALLTCGFLLVVIAAGWITVGHAQPHHFAGPKTLASTLRTHETISITAAPSGQLAFAPNSIRATTGLVRFKIFVAAAGHTFGFHDPTTRFAQLILDAAGQTKTGVAFFAAPGDYTFFCSVDGHEAAGMRGVVHVTGPPLTLEQALTNAHDAVTTTPPTRT